ncbi:conserved protein of unknown function [Ectopseudomonas oleovorans]|uniref:Uncharacterized protein n=1 Tax=Ectopseudomonas oleovorans TaxID=301 RepID=A0A653BCK2_ECTOL|nr:conserved protein of unknown function [Pseudomonas oleovorans]
MRRHLGRWRRDVSPSADAPPLCVAVQPEHGVGAARGHAAGARAKPGAVAPGSALRRRLSGLPMIKKEAAQRGGSKGQPEGPASRGVALL